jgi:putative RNA 2'-phosphotransferase
MSNDEKRLVKRSKYLSKHLRHRPERIGLELEKGGWVNVDVLLAACAAHGMTMTRAELDHVVSDNNKQRFSFDESGKRIRANQGHSVDVDLQLPEVEPPAVLYHGTARHNVDSIRKVGLEKCNRHHVHLSADTDTATMAGQRHGAPKLMRSPCVRPGMHSTELTMVSG